MPLRFKCLLIDHDDTAVNSTAAIHYPSHLQCLRELRPDRSAPSLEEWFLINFRGIIEHLEGELGFTRDEMKREMEIWRDFTAGRTPEFYPGFLSLMADFRREGGRVAVISHSDGDVIASHYALAGIPEARPDLIFGWQNDAARRKPSPWPVREALRRFGLNEKEALILDDLKPGVLMSRATGVPAAAAGWGHNIPEIVRYMRENTIAYFQSVGEVRAFLFLS
jgi:beta-phosphoglucomutase-like phosphatase (HAD superfamily)